MNQMLHAYQALGGQAFTQMVTQTAPYFSTIDPEFVELRPNFAELTFSNRKEVHNHIGTVHAIAMCNAAELVAGTMTNVSLPEGRRWIPSGMTVKYEKKAKTDLQVIADGNGIDWSASEAVVPVKIFDTEGAQVFSAQITMNLK